jgi:hypothetical protein
MCRSSMSTVTGRRPRLFLSPACFGWISESGHRRCRTLIFALPRDDHCLVSVRSHHSGNGIPLVSLANGITSNPKTKAIAVVATGTPMLP